MGIERRRMLKEQIKPAINPFDQKTSKKNSVRTSPKMSSCPTKIKQKEEEIEFDMTVTPHIYEDDPVGLNISFDDDEEEDEEDDDGGGWFGAEGIVDMSDHEMEEHEVHEEEEQ